MIDDGNGMIIRIITHDLASDNGSVEIFVFKLHKKGRRMIEDNEVGNDAMDDDDEVTIMM
jgi:hypothetical protein